MHSKQTQVVPTQPAQAQVSPPGANRSRDTAVRAGTFRRLRDTSAIERISEAGTSQSVHGPSKPWQRRLLDTMLASMGRPAVAVTLWDGFSIQPPVIDGQRAGIIGTITINSPSTLASLLRYRDIGFGDEFMSGGIHVDGSLLDVICELDIAKTTKRPGALQRVFETTARASSRRPLRNTLLGSRENAGHHYNLGNEFYSLWLDREMQYTCAYFARETMTLEEAQVAKMEHVCRKLELKPGDTVLEAGCGWGGLARYMATHYGVTVRAYNVSKEQVKYATQRARALGLDDRIQYVEDDYRNATGSYDKFVSVGMLEHVGVDNYKTLGQVIDRSLKEDGRGLIHSIGRNKAKRMNPWIEKRIFPGAHPPSVREMMDIFETPNFSITDVENLRLHYATTLECWTERFERHEPRVREMFDSDFVRMWRLYLVGSTAAFLTSSLQLFQISFARARDNSVPFNREHLYRD